MTASLTQTLIGTWNADTIHTDIGFKVRHMGVGKVRGSFALTSATVTIPESGIGNASVQAVIDATSVDTKQEQRDAHVKSADFLDAENHPTITFTSTGVKNFDGESLILVGELTIRGISRTVELDTEILGVTTDAYGFERAGFSATTSFSRKDFGVAFNAVFGAGNAGGAPTRSRSALIWSSPRPPEYLICAARPGRHVHRTNQDRPRTFGSRPVFGVSAFRRFGARVFARRP